MLSGFLTPRMVMHEWEASITTPTPRAFRDFTRRSARSSVSLSCTWGRRERHSTTLASLLSPTILPFGRYAMCALPLNGSMWCSHMLWNLMFLTRTISSYFCTKVFSRKCVGSLCNPENISAYMRPTLAGVSFSPSLSGSSPTAKRISLTAACILA